MLKEVMLGILRWMGQKVFYILGKRAKGSSFKMLVNAMLAQSMILFSEADLARREKMGLDKNFLLDTLPKLTGRGSFHPIQSQT